MINGQIETCPHCGSIVSERKIVLDRTMVSAMWRVFKWCKEKNVHEFYTRDVAHLFSKTQYARFGDTIYFGGIVYKHAKAHYGLNMERAEAFFRNQLAVSRSIWKNSVTKAITKPEELIVMSQIPKLMTLMNDDGEYIANYRSSTPPLTI